MLLSDVGLDRPCEWATPAIASSRRAAAKQALVDILIEARRQSVELIACAGDLFDRHTVRPATMQWLMTALCSAAVPVLIAPGNEDFVGPLGGYARHRWPPNVHIFTSDRLAPHECAGGVTIWGAANRQAHSASSFLDGVHVDRGGVKVPCSTAPRQVGTNVSPASSHAHHSPSTRSRPPASISPTGSLSRAPSRSAPCLSRRAHCPRVRIAKSRRSGGGHGHG